MSGECFYVIQETDCEACDGKGVIKLMRCAAEGVKPYQTECTACNGKGRLRHEVKLAAALRRLAENDK